MGQWDLCCFSAAHLVPDMPQPPQIGTLSIAGFLANLQGNKRTREDVFSWLVAESQQRQNLTKEGREIFLCCGSKEREREAQGTVKEAQKERTHRQVMGMMERLTVLLENVVAL